MTSEEKRLAESSLTPIIDSLFVGLAGLMKYRPCRENAKGESMLSLEDIFKSFLALVPGGTRLAIRLRMLAALCGREKLGYPGWLDYEQMIKDEAPDQHYLHDDWVQWLKDNEKRYQSDGRLIIAFLRLRAPSLQKNEARFVFESIDPTRLVELALAAYKLLLKGCDSARLVTTNDKLPILSLEYIDGVTAVEI